ncbi:hypothetical protein CLAFUW4_09863 [Fulvia fulva]|uniref:Uncharacterized protein n=1 Tax=Passalora fulva TaxID=5499 RepID=A0A9Q8UUQ9_PASFU|nr:uncharacterized protein CLAFUR5_12376 [Fulvia fulva]KAK4616250.1 hypothetical protein CLAFUR4_09869 [Fulvia fulva]KAK4617399.1 hypothetical protein CLAFUR0_09862 [Fulvia fulva]UJO23229.1 hypothetical protein CLAFUR5_12376 [Fulvia fulva]WPV19232.1 hypothetical protein CLAFUW4_09863 [Fulvia fulva]WPV34293.1 hypothetical protein CLAFUW7_09866 [Fulvia fulva]
MPSRNDDMHRPKRVDRPVSEGEAVQIATNYEKHSSTKRVDRNGLNWIVESNPQSLNGGIVGDHSANRHLPTGAHLPMREHKGVRRSIKRFR